jgi:glycosyltransferase involved in cell wall biosynthesis
MKIVEITDLKSHAIHKYIKNLSNTFTTKGYSFEIQNWKFAKRSDSDIFHYHYSNSTTKVLLPLLLSKKKSNLVTIHDIVPRNKLWRTILSPIFVRIIDSRSTRIVVHSDFAKRMLYTQYPFVDQNKVLVIPHGCKNIYCSNKQLKESRKNLELDQDEIIFLFLGFLKKSKGIVETIEAFKLVKSKKN